MTVASDEDDDAPTTPAPREETLVCCYASIPWNETEDVATLDFAVAPSTRGAGDALARHLVRAWNARGGEHDEENDVDVDVEVEITCLRRPPTRDGDDDDDDDDDAFGVYAYSRVRLDDRGTEEPNVRATRLAMAVGSHHKRFLGTVCVGRVGRDLRPMDLRAEELESACSFSPDLRTEILKGVDDVSTTTVPRWLANAARENYRDSKSLARLASVMGARDESSDDDDTSHASDSSSSSFVDRDDDERTTTTRTEPRRATTTIASSPPSVDFETTLCLHCRRPTTSLCENCEGAYFCDGDSSRCRESGWSHRCLCPTWRVYVDRRAVLSDFPFPWHGPLVAPSCYASETPYEDFLRRRGLLGSGWWSTETGGWWSVVDDDTARSSSVVVADPSVRVPYGRGFGPSLDPRRDLPDPTPLVVDDDDRRCPYTGLVEIESWEEYYRLRGLPLSSPAALLLTFPLTIHHAICRYGRVPAYVCRLSKRPLRVHVVGVEKEINFADLFQEVGFLLPRDLELDLVFVVRRDMLPPVCRLDVDRRDSSSPVRLRRRLCDNVRLTVVAGTYNTEDLDPDFDCGDASRPDLIVGPNAGLFAYDSWRSVVRYLEDRPNVVGVFTDYNEHSGTNCAALLGCRESLRVNPFRQPRASPVRCMNLPQFSNGFVYACNEQPELDA